VSEVQAYLPSLAILIVVALGILVNNSRISDLNTNLNKRIDDLRADSRDKYARLETLMVGKLTEVEARLARIEAHLNLH
jgi:hypothetical protein